MMTPKQARELLDMLKSFPSMAALRQQYLEAIEVLRNSSDTLDQLLAELRADDLPENAWRFKKPTIVPLTDRYVHRIWVTGQALAQREAQTGMLTQPRVPGWTNLLWVYNDFVAQPHRVVQVHGHRLAVQQTLTVFGTPLYQINFRRTMELWGERPGWIDEYIQYLDVMLTKKAYVAMGDIMRMILLWFMGGVYVDVKIQFDVVSALAFFRNPQTAQDRLMCVHSGHGLENWAMMSHVRCDMVREILWVALSKRLPSLARLQRMPVNWSHASGKYSKAHVQLHEDKSVWPVLQSRYAEQIVLFSEVQPELKLKNPRPANSWQDNDGVAFDWTE